MVREEFFEGYGRPNDHHVAAGWRAIFDPVDAKRSAAGTLQMSHGRYALVGTARVATRAIEMIASTAIWPSRIACRAFAHVCSIENCRVIPVDSTFAVPVRHRQFGIR
jgi:hypothetical protein